MGLVSMIDETRARGIHNIMTLRGDSQIPNTDPSLRYASDLIQLIKQRTPDLNILVATYPEGHPECPGGLSEDLDHLKYKLSCGGTVAITQFFLDPKIYLHFRDQLRRQNPTDHYRLIPGIILFSTVSGMWRLIKMVKGSITVPQKIIDDATFLEKNHDTNAMREWGFNLACHLCQELYLSGERFFHIYTLNADDTVCRLVRFIDDLPRSLTQ